MMKIFSSFMASLFIINSHPIMKVLIIIVSSLLISFNLFIHINNQWLNYILILTFLGGMMVLFLYVSSLIPNENLTLMKNSYWILILIIFMEPTFKSSTMHLSDMKMTYTIYWSPIFFMIFIILILLIFVLKMIFEPFNPLKSSIIYEKSN